jgi:beta-lactamase class A
MDVSGQSSQQAEAMLTSELAAVIRPIELRAGAQTTIIKPEAINLRLALEAMLAEAIKIGSGARVALQIEYEQDQLRTILEQLDEQVSRRATVALADDTAQFTSRFVTRPGVRLDIAAALQRIDQRLHAPGSPQRINLALKPWNSPVERTSRAQLQREIEAMTEQWEGVIGVYVYDLAHDRTIAKVNEQTVFSAASSMKVAIMLQTYIALPRLTAQQQEWLAQMIIESDNRAANNLLAISGNGNAAQGARQMTETLQSLGLTRSYLRGTYALEPDEAPSAPRNPAPRSLPSEVAATPIPSTIRPPQEPTPEPPPAEPPPEGGASSDGLFNLSLALAQESALTTDADPYLQTTPAEMGQLFIWIDQCSRGEGVLREKFASRLTASRCQEMLDLLAQNDDGSRMVSGLPADARVAHKSGWIETMQADVGIVRSPGGDFLLSVYIYRDGLNANDLTAKNAIAGFARLVYSWFNLGSEATLAEDAGTEDAEPEADETGDGQR